MDIWAVITQKGGSGKTTIALHLAIMAENRGRKAVVIDLDPQRSAIKWARIRGGNSPEVVSAIASELNKALADAEKRGCKLAIIDTSPRADKDALEVARRADLIIVPVRPSILDLPAMEDTLKLIQMSGRLHRTAIVLNSVASHTNEGKDASAVLQGLGPLLPVQIGERVDFRRALTGGFGVTEYAPSSKAAKEMENLYKALEQKSAR
jgi:chromosome partitioning protein